MSLDTIASIATALGVFFAAWQILQNKKISQNSFEDNLDQQYRQLAMAIPVDALIGEPISKNKEELREIIYN